MSGSAEKDLRASVAKQGGGEPLAVASGLRMDHETVAGMSSEGRVGQLLIPSDMLAVRQPEREILQIMRRFGYPEQTVFAVKLALEEALINAIRHGNRNDLNRYVTVRYDVNPARTVVVVADEGDGFRPEQVPDPTTSENISKPCGRGIMLMRAYMDEVRYSRKGNLVRMVKYNRTLK